MQSKSLDPSAELTLTENTANAARTRAEKGNMPWLDSAPAYGNTRKSATHIWSSAGSNPVAEDVTPANGGARIFGDLSTGLSYERKFKLDPNMKVFTIGSCFARNVEVALLNRKFDVMTRTGNFGYPHGHLNRYNTLSMLQELDFGTGRKTFHADSIVQLPKGFADLTASGLFDSTDTVLDFRAKTTRLFSKVVDADLVIITAGLTEVWYDRRFNQYLNVAPSQASLSEPDRFEFRVLDYGANLGALHDLVKVLHQLVPAAKIIMSVSPVPLNATFLPRDVLISNAYSKACLRAAVEEIYWSYDFVDYFPSYEMVALSDPSLAWESDRRHVKAAFVGQVMHAFEQIYIDS